MSDLEVKMPVEVHEVGVERPAQEKLTIVGYPDEELEPGQVLLAVEKVSLVVNLDDLRRGLRAFRRGRR